MKRDLLMVGLTAALACSLTLLGVVAVGFHTGTLALTAMADPLTMALNTDGSQLAVIYPVGGPADVEAMQRVVAKGRP